jgi:hypothetical protein
MFHGMLLIYRLLAEHIPSAITVTPALEQGNEIFIVLTIIIDLL